jgi:small ligand-binding sensory domain FIST
MLRAGAAVSTHPKAVPAVEEAVSQALGAAGGRADAAILLATPGHTEAMRPLLDAAVGALGCDRVIGTTAHGVLGAAGEFEGGPAIAVAVLSGIEAEAFLLTDLDPLEPLAGEEIAARLGGPARPEDLVVLFPDPRSVPLLAMLEDVRLVLAPAVVVGAGAADPVWDRPQQWCGREVAAGALAGVVLRGARRPRVGVTQACRPVTEVMTVTRVQGHWILELDGRPALDVYREVARGPLGEDLRRAAGFVLAALPTGGERSLDPGSYRVRNVAGFALEEKALALPEALAPGDPFALAVREPQTARDDLKAMLAGLPADGAALGLYFDCCARGSSFFGVSGLESGYLEQALGATPFVGMFGSCEIGPVGGRAELLTYTGVLALIDA